MVRLDKRCPECGHLMELFTKEAFRDDMTKLVWKCLCGHEIAIQPEEAQ